jgi:hypothetical protein
MKVVPLRLQLGDRSGARPWNPGWEDRRSRWAA